MQAADYIRCTQLRGILCAKETMGRQCIHSEKIPVFFSQGCYRQYIRCGDDQMQPWNQMQPKHRDEKATLSVVWRWVASISTGQVPFSIFRGHWPCFLVDESSSVYRLSPQWLLCHFASWRVPPLFILATHRNTSEGVDYCCDKVCTGKHNSIRVPVYPGRQGVQKCPLYSTP